MRNLKFFGAFLCLLLTTSVHASHYGENDIHLIKLFLPSEKTVVYYWMKMGTEKNGECEWNHAKPIRRRAFINGETFFVDGDEVKRLAGLDSTCASVFFQISPDHPISNDYFHLVKNSPGTAYISSWPFSTSVTITY